MPKPDKSKGQRDRVKVIDDEKKRTLELRPMELVPPSVGIFDEPTRCYRINQEWAKIVMGLVSWLATVAAWKDAQHEGYIGITEILRFMQGDTCDMPFQLRQNPTNSCLIEQSTDGGETWLTAFDLSLCMSIVDGSNINTQTTNFVVNNYESFQEYVYRNYVNNYINNVTDLVPELGYTGGALDDFRDAALCHALTKFIDSVCDAAIRYYDEFEDTGRDALAYLAMGAAVLGIVAIAATGFGAVALAALATTSAAGLGIFSATGAVLVDWWADGSREMYQDESAKEDVVCCLFETLTGANFNQSNFIDAFEDDCGLTGNALEIFGAAAIIGRENATYAAMVENMRIGYNSAQLGLLPNCGCDDGYSMLDYQFDEAQFYFKAVTGVWQETYFEGEEVAVFPATSRRVILQINRKWSGAPLKAVGIGVNYDAIQDCGITGITMQFKYQGSNTTGFSISPVGSALDQKRTWGVSLPTDGFFADELTVTLDVRKCDGSLPTAIAKAVRIWLDTDSEVRGLPVPDAPIGTGPNGTADAAWWI